MLFRIRILCMRFGCLWASVHVSCASARVALCLQMTGHMLAGGSFALFAQLRRQGLLTSHKVEAHGSAGKGAPAGADVRPASPAAATIGGGDPPPMVRVPVCHCCRAPSARHQGMTTGILPANRAMHGHLQSHSCRQLVPLQGIRLNIPDAFSFTPCWQDWRQRLVAGNVVQEALRFMVVLGVGAIMGDGVLTPAVSVVSAVEGLELAASGISRGLSDVMTLLPVERCSSGSLRLVHHAEGRPIWHAGQPF